MIEKIIRISNVGKLEKLIFKGTSVWNRELGVKTVIHGRNGQGKTTLVAILRSLAEQDSDSLVGRRTLGGSGDPDVSIRIDGAPIQFKNGQWTQKLPCEIEIFDEQFVAKAIYSGAGVTAQQAQILHDFVIGERGVELAREIDELDIKIAHLQKSEKDLVGEIERHTERFIPTDEFIDAPLTADLSSKIEAQSLRVLQARSADTIKQLPEYSLLSIPAIDIERIEQVLGSTLDSIPADVDRAVRAHMAQLHDDPTESWLIEGIAIATDVCPLCGQSLSASKVWEHLKVHFGQVYRAYRQEIEVEIGRVLDEVSLNRIEEIANVVDTNASLSAEAKDAGAPILERPDSISLRRSMSDCVQALDKVFQDKAVNPIEPILLPAEVTETLRTTLVQLESIERYNDEARNKNAALEVLKRDTQDMNVEAELRKLKYLKTMALRTDPSVETACSNLRTTREQIKTAKGTRVKAKDNLSSHTSDVINGLGTVINDLLRRFGADFQIADPKTGYVGKRPRLDYQIKIRDSAIKLGTSNTPTSEPSFKNTLSQGDKNALALAFFLARLQNDPALGEKIVLIDDPISSFDEHRRSQSAFAIRDIAVGAKQLLVMTHSASFAALLGEHVRDVTLLTLFNSALGPTTIDDLIRTDYMARYVRVREFAESANGEAARVADDIRVVLETSLRFRFPLEFTHKDWLGDMVTKIEQAKSGDPLGVLLSDLREIRAVKDYSNQFHHDRTTRPVHGQLDDIEVKYFAEIVCRLCTK